MKIKALQSSYRKNGNIQFVYSLDCSPEEKKAYKANKGDYYKENEQEEPLFWSQRSVPVGTELKESSKGTFYPVTNLADEAEALDIATINKRGNIRACLIEFGMSKQELLERMF